MPLVSQTIASFKGGVSQQPDILRYPDQLREQINGFSNEIEGLQKRAPTVHVKRLFDKIDDDNVKMHFINRDAEEKYLVMIRPKTNNVTPTPPPVEGKELTIDFKNPGTFNVELPQWVKSVECVTLGAGGGGAYQTGYQGSIVDGTDGGSSFLTKNGANRIGEATGGIRANYVRGVEGGSSGGGSGAGGSPNGNKGQTAITGTPGNGARAPTNIFGDSYGYGADGGEMYTVAGGYWQHQYVGGGGSGGYNTSGKADILPTDTLTVTVGFAGACGIRYPGYEATGAYYKNAGHGAVRITLRGEVTGEGDSSGEGRIRVFRLSDGNEVPVSVTTSGSNYLADMSGDIHSNLAAVTVADFTFILNKQKVTRMTAQKAPTGATGGLIVIKGANYGKLFNVLINGASKASYRCPDGSNPSHANSATPQNVIAQLSAGLTSNQIPHTAGQGWIHLPNLTENDEVVFSDDFGGSNGYFFRQDVSTITKLPTSAPEGYVVHITGDSSTDDDDYWLKWDTKKNNWTECAKPGVLIEFDKSTLPHALIRKADGSFSFEPLNWENRTTGDDDSNGIPSFIDYPINDIFFFRNRLGFLAEENVILSQSASFFNFWFNSAAAIADTDPIDVAVSSNRASTLSHAIPFSQELALFSKEVQFMMRADGALSPKNVRVDQTTTYNYDTKCAPASLGRSIYFLTRKAEYSSVNRYYEVEDVADIKDAEDVTAHCPTYVNNGVYHLAGTTADNTLVALSKFDKRYLWVYKFFMQGGQNVQQSWSKWFFGDGGKVIAAQFLDDTLYIAFNRTSGVFLEKMSLRGNTKDFADEPIRLFMDRKIEYMIPNEDASYDIINNETLIQLGEIYGESPEVGTYGVVGLDGRVFEVSGDKGNWKLTNGSVRIPGDWRGRKVFVGEIYPMEFYISQQLIKQPNAKGAVIADDEGRLQLRYMWFNYAISGPFEVNVNIRNRAWKYVFTPRILGDSNNVLGELPVTSGKFRFPVQALNKEADISVVSNNVMPVNLLSGGWEGMYNRRNQRI